MGREEGSGLVRRLASARLALALGVLAFVLNVAGLVIVALAGRSVTSLLQLMALLPTVVIGVLVAVRRPGNPLAWLMIGIDVLISVQIGAVAYSILDYRLHHGSLPLGRLAVALQPAWALGLVLVAGCLWLFPKGHLPAGRWRRVGGFLFGAGLVYGILMFVPWAVAAARPVIRIDPGGAPYVIDHPAGSGLIWPVVENVGFFALIISWLVWLVVQVPKYRRSDGERRLQLKWLYSGAVIFVACLTVGLLQPNDPSASWQVISALVAPGLAALPIALGIGILKFRLYEIDRIISRTLSYALVTGLIVGVYVGVVTLATRVLPFPGQVGVAASTLIAAVLFNPLRKRVQRAVDRRFNRAHYDAEATVAAFAGRLRDSVDLPSMQNELAATVRQAFEPVHVTVWLPDREPQPAEREPRLAGPQRLPLDERPDLRPGSVAHVDRSESSGRFLQVRDRGIALAVRVQQVGHVRVQRRDPVLVAEFAAQFERFGRERQRLGAAAGLGQQPGQVVQGRDGRAQRRGRRRLPTRDRRGRRASTGFWPPPSYGQALPQVGFCRASVPGPGGEHAEHVERLGRGVGITRGPGAGERGLAEDSGLVCVTAPVRDDGAVGFGPGHPARLSALDQFGHDGEVRFGQFPVTQAVVHVGQFVLDSRLRGAVAFAAGDGRGGLELG
jgi:hypothetical protein